jgi:hypothetical protein
LDAAVTTGQSLRIQGKTPKTKVGMYTLPQGCSAKREIITNESAFVHSFIYARSLNAEIMKNLTISGYEQRRRPIAGEMKGRRRC